MRITKVTITGADNDVHVKDLADLTAEYPFVEWGILFSSKREGTPRYPDYRWRKVFERDILKSNAAAHLCGDFAKMVIDAQDVRTLEARHGYNRIQLNYRFDPNYINLSVITKFFTAESEKNIILQYNKNNSTHLLPMDKILTNQVHYLYDSSGGRGITFGTVPYPFPNRYTGYSGGISPDNIESVCGEIGNLPDESEVWIDMESGVRTDDKFDLNKVIYVLNVCKKYIKQ